MNADTGIQFTQRSKSKDSDGKISLNSASSDRQMSQANMTMDNQTLLNYDADMMPSELSVSAAPSTHQHATPLGLNK